MKKSIASFTVATLAMLSSTVSPISATAASFQIWPVPNSVTNNCVVGATSCEYTASVRFVNIDSRTAYQASFWNDSSTYSKVFFRPEGTLNFVNAPVVTNRTLETGNSMQVDVKVNLTAQEIAQYFPAYTGKLYGDAKSCNLNFTPATCMYMGGVAYEIKVPIASPAATPTPTPTPKPLPLSTPTPAPTPAPVYASPRINSTMATPALSLPNVSTRTIIRITGSGFNSGKSNVGTTYRSVFLTDYRGMTVRLPDSTKLSWSDSDIIVGKISSRDVATLRSRDLNGKIQPIKVYVEIFDYTNTGRRTLGKSNVMSL